MDFRPPERFNLADYLLDERVREGRGERLALRHDGGELTYREVQALADRFARVLAKLGALPEQRVLVALDDTPEFAGALFGVLKLGAVAVMVNPQLPPAELARLYEYTRARVAVVEHAVLPAFVEAAQIAGAAGSPVLLTVGGASSPHPSFEEEAARVPAGFRNASTHRDDPAIWLFSGGTTGRPKAVVQTHTSYANTTECYGKAFLGYGEGDVTLSVPKLYFGYATGANLFFPFAVGGSAILFRARPTPEVLFAQIRAHRPTILVNVPTMVHHLVTHPAAAAQDLSCLRFSISAGEALPAPLYHRFKETFGIELLDGLGTAEMWHIFLSNHPGDVRPGTLGKAVPGFEVKVCDDDGNPLPAGEPGRLWVKGRSRAIGYWQEMEKTAETFRGEWVVTGDLLSRDEDGYFTYCGRADDVLKVGGRWFVPQEVESCLIRHPAVAECAVVGIVTADGLTKPRAYVIARERRPGLEEELKAFVLRELAPYKHPREIVFVDDLPRTHLGKVDRGKLKQAG
ncbi:MAG TPA: benzoate-CoA ligase family protein [Thermoanaerobaculia bacterium]|nr:benzoate-CoA ligase family protein [Thermoanaerobaculia bacterium]